ncbi:hypothetical protein KC19_2G111700 [Ceratodon purpureus]|uniref:Uncharacterized protein n=1 Tax=Ceratodon purpureus TaxID=3225 RepID=A0A8T0IU97_CERPU|nr:hypothetical protein KC19_2G111700 [Ceratodon purpureus]
MLSKDHFLVKLFLVVSKACACGEKFRQFKMSLLNWSLEAGLESGLEFYSSNSV